MNWIDSTVGEFCPFIYGKGLPQSKRKAGNVPVYGSNGRVDYHDESHVKQHGIVIGRKGSVGAIHLCEEPFWPIDTAFYVEKESIDELRFTYYLLKSLGLEHMNSDSAVPGLNRENAQSLTIRIPEQVQDREALGAWIAKFDQKIALNQQINQTLESMAQAIFKSWFVDFDPVKAKIAALKVGEDTEGVTRAAMRAISGKTDDELDEMEGGQPEDYAKIKTTAGLFPAAMQDSELGEVPEGWKVGCVGDVTEKIFSGGTPNTKTEAFWNGGLNWFSSGETRNMVIIDTEKKITEKGAKDSSTKLAIYGDILIASAGQGHTRGQTSFCAMDTFINQSVVSIRASDRRLSSWLFFNLSGRYEEMRSISDSHSIRGSLTTKLLSSLSTVIPSASLGIEYGKLAEGSLILTAENLRQSQVLSKLRDSLLPKFMSGEIQVKVER